MKKEIEKYLEENGWTRVSEEEFDEDFPMDYEKGILFVRFDEEGEDVEVGDTIYSVFDWESRTYAPATTVYWATPDLLEYEIECHTLRVRDQALRERKRAKDALDALHELPEYRRALEEEE